MIRRCGIEQAGGVAAVYSIRRKRPEFRRAYSVLGYPVTPAIFLGAAILLLANARVAEPLAPLVFAMIALRIPVFWLWNSRVSSRPRH